jgi:hypothetical protein
MRCPEAAIPFKEFLEKVHPSVMKKATGVWEQKMSQVGSHAVLATPNLRLHCPDCEGERTFRCNEEVRLSIKVRNGVFVSYRCGDCHKALKLFSLFVVTSKAAARAEVYKYGELPSFGVPVPNKLLRLFGTDSKVFLKGRQCENQGLGIGAFAYYRRVVENHKNEIFDEIIRVCETLKASPTLVEELRSAKGAVSFAKAMDHIKTGLPDGLLMDGHNPLLALHGALSVGLHKESDEECLEAASAVRLVLTDLAEKMSLLRQDKAELSRAVELLLSKKGS